MTPTKAWRATLHALTGLPIGVVSFALTCGLPAATIYSAVWSLIYAPRTDWPLTGLFVVLALVLPVPLLRTVPAITALQRRRFRALAGFEIPPPPPHDLRSPGTWRQVGYHVLALFLGAAGAAAVAACWLAFPLLLGSEPAWSVVALPALAAAPWVARSVVRVDVALARALLGPSRTTELSARVESLSRSRADILAATDAERRRIERDLHDGAQQRLVSLAMNLGMARASLDGTPGPARQAIEAAHDEATQALTELREFVRGLHPAVLNDRGLDAALSGIAARAPLPVRVRVTDAPRCSPVIEAIAYFIVSEALTNIAKHARATSAGVTVDRAAGHLRVVVTDDGQGGATTGRGTGLSGLAQRAASVDGTFSLHSPVGGPTTITVELPCAS